MKHFEIFEIWYADLPFMPGSHVQYGLRPVIIVSNNLANAHSHVATVVPLTSRNKTPLPTRVRIQSPDLDKESIALCEQILTIDESRLKRRVGFVYDGFDRLSLHQALCIQLGMAA